MLYISMPRFIRPSVGMADVVTEVNALAADFTFCHDSNPPYSIRFAVFRRETDDMITDNYYKCKQKDFIFY